MEKRLVISIALSLLVVFVFQKFIAPPPIQNQQQTTQVDAQEEVTWKNASVPSSIDAQNPFVAKNSVDFVVPVADSGSFQEKIEKFTLNGYGVTFSNKGGDLSSLELIAEEYQFPIKNIVKLDAFQNEAFVIDQVTSREITASFENDQWKVVKTYRADKDFQMDVSVSMINKQEMATVLDTSRLVLLEADLSRMDKSENRSDWTLMEYAYKENKIRRKGNASSFNDKWNKKVDVNVDWMAFRDRYFVTLVDPENDFLNIDIVALGEKNLSLGSQLSTIKLNPNEEFSLNFHVFAGPQRVDILKEAGYNSVMAFSDWGWLDAIAKFIHMVMSLIHKVVPLWGACIILMALLIYGVTYPLTFKSLKSMRKMQTLQPKMAALKKKYEKNPEQMNKEVMELYKREGVNPLGGCLPMVFQMPIFIGIYQVIWRSFYFRGESFLWIADLSKPDHLFKLPFTIPFLGEYFNILPILVTGIMVVQQKMNATNMATADADQQAQQKMMATIFPLFLGVIFYNFSAGLNLYFVVFYILSTFTQWKIAQEVKVVS